MKQAQIYLPDLVGKGYKTFWNWKGRYRVVKGSRRSKKSKTMALWSIYNIMKYPESNMMVIRKTFRTIKDSCFTELKWAIHRLHVDHLWKVVESPLEMTYLPTGQKIYFRGLDDPLKVTSITVEVGVLCWVWIEEAYEIMSEDDFDMIAESILGDCPPHLWKQLTLIFNPWNEHHWIKKRFFDDPDEETLAMTTNYLCNEWLSDADRKTFDTMKAKNPRRYRTAGLGEWGIVDGLVYENWKEQDFDIKDPDFQKEHPHLVTAAGLDFGYTNDPSAFFIGFLDEKQKKLFVWDEIYKKGLSNRKIFNEILEAGYAKERITGDSSEPKSIDELRSYGLRIKGAVKGKDSINNGIQYIQDLEIIIHPRCVNFETEISNYTWDKDRFGKIINKPVDDFNHLMDAMRYALESFIRQTGHYNRNVKGGI